MGAELRKLSLYISSEVDFFRLYVQYSINARRFQGGIFARVYAKFRRVCMGRACSSRLSRRYAARVLRATARVRPYGVAVAPSTFAAVCGGRKAQKKDYAICIVFYVLCSDYSAAFFAMSKPVSSLSPALATSVLSSVSSTFSKAFARESKNTVLPSSA